MNVREQFSVISNSGVEIDVLIFQQTDYLTMYQAMSVFATTRDDMDRDQIWLVEHPAVYTQGTACTQDTLLPSDIPIVKTDRGGQITYHGPGQVVMYPLLRLKRFGLGVKALVSTLEQCVIETLQDYKIKGELRDDAPGVYVNHAKIAALGLRIRRGNCYHGLSFNIDMDLSPFSNVDPCGYKGLQVVQLSSLITQKVDTEKVSQQLLKKFLKLI